MDTFYWILAAVFVLPLVFSAGYHLGCFHCKKPNPKPKVVCPHEFCVHQMLAVPAYDDRGLPVVEQCSACGGWVKFDHHDKNWVRYVPRGVP